MSERQKIYAALVASVLLHLLGFVVMSLWGRLHPANPNLLANVKLVELTIAPTPTPVPAIVQVTQLEQPAATPVPIDSDGLQKSEKEPERALFQSDQNSKAGSELPATVDLPLPSQQGKERRELAFETKRFSPGAAAARFAPPPEFEFAPAPQRTEEPRPASTPASQPTPVARQEPTPDPTPAPTPRAEPSATPLRDAEPLYRPTPVPLAAPSSTPDETTRPTPVPVPKPVKNLALLTKPPKPNPQPEEKSQPQNPGANVETQQSKIEGGISNRGKTGVDAIGTPVGRYRKKIADTIGSRWNLYVKQRMDLITTGSVRIKFFITQRGGVEDLKVMRNDANHALEDFSVQAIINGKLPEIPTDLTPALDKGRFEVEYTFTIYPD